MASRNRNERGRFKAKNAQVANAGAVDVMNEADIPALSNMLQNGRTTFVLIWADWCGHCHRYKPTWEKLAKIPGRNANIASVHHDMQEKIPELADAKIQGYPSVVKVTPGGEIEEFPEEGNASASVAKTNAIPYMRDERVMAKELRNAPVAAPAPVPAPPPSAAAPVAAPASPPAAKDSATPGTQIGITSDSALKNTEAMFDIQQSGGAHPLIAAFANAARQAAPAVALLASYVALQQRKHSRTFKAPKRASRRASTRRSRRTG
jgi:thiol-disulfide isomerase/thioredoxin